MVLLRRQSQVKAAGIGDVPGIAIRVYGVEGTGARDVFRIQQQGQVAVVGIKEGIRKKTAGGQQLPEPRRSDRMFQHQALVCPGAYMKHLESQFFQGVAEVCTPKHQNALVHVPAPLPWSFRTLRTVRPS